MRISVAVICLMSCAQGNAPAGRPVAPEFEAAEPVSLHRKVVLRGHAEDQVVVRLFAAENCLGPTYRQVAATDFASGVEVELVSGQENVFSAHAVSNRGLVSECTASLRIQFPHVSRPEMPVVDREGLRPSPQKTRFVVKGKAEEGALVRLHKFWCEEAPLSVLSSPDFENVGFTIDVGVNTEQVFALDAVVADRVSECAGPFFLLNDEIPPSARARLASPSPSLQRSAYIRVDIEVGASVDFFSTGLDCGGERLVEQRIYVPGALSPELRIVEFPADTASDFSVRVGDRAGNTACVAGEGVWVHNPALHFDESVLIVRDSPVHRVLVPVGRSSVELFPNENCREPWVAKVEAPLIALAGARGAPTSGFLTARSYRSDGGVDPCSPALDLGP